MPARTRAVPTTSVPLSAKVSSPCAPVAVDDSQDEACVSDDHRSRGEVSRVYHRWEDAAIGVLAKRKKPRCLGEGASTERRQEILVNGRASNGLVADRTVRRDQSCPHGHLARFLRSSAEPAAGFAQTRGRVYAAGVGGGERASGESLPTMRRFTPCPSRDTSCAWDVHPTRADRFRQMREY